MADLSDPGRSARTRSGRAALSVIAILVLGLTAGCGKEVQTNQPYTPALGVNVDVPPPGGPAQIRNLLILSRTEGQGVLSATLSMANGQDSLAEVTGSMISATGEEVPLTVNLSAPVPVTFRAPVVLTDRPAITVTSPELQAGLEAKLTLRWANSGEVTLAVPVVDATQTEFRTLSPSPAPSS